jgi:tRNA U34 2-thiouridine synthase MnmA/TrmU
MKALALFSGGLDSILAAKLVLEQNIEVEAVNFSTLFWTYKKKENSHFFVKSIAEELGIKLKVFEVSKDFLEILKKPKYGYGSGMNPCIDCRIFILKKASKYMRESGASFLITGEVLNERPMSQRMPILKLIEKESGLTGLILRPLSAKLLEQTIPEEKKWIDRDKLLSIRGRSRKIQLELAKKFGIKNYFSPSGGCLLTDPSFSCRIKDLMRYSPDFNLDDVRLLKLGRHFRLSDRAKLVVGRNEKENEQLLNFNLENSLFFYPLDAKGPVALGRGFFDKDLILLSARIVAYYCDKENLSSSLKIIYKNSSLDIAQTLEVHPLIDLKVKELQI